MADPEEFTSQRAALNAALAHAPLLPRDVSTVALARRLAERLDEIDDMITNAEEDDRGMISLEGVRDKVTGRYLACLDRLGMSPGARPASRGGEPDGTADPAAVALALLQSGKPPPGVDYAAAVDPAVTAADAGD